MKKEISPNIDPELIAPCGLNCRLCRAYIRENRTCPGCRGDDDLKSQSSVSCWIKTCEKLKSEEIRFCSSCNKFPCGPLNRLDNRYRTNYGVSEIANLNEIKLFGLSHFVESENERWIGPECGRMIDMHKPQCPSCGCT